MVNAKLGSQFVQWSVDPIPESFVLEVCYVDRQLRNLVPRKDIGFTDLFGWVWGFVV